MYEKLVLSGGGIKGLAYLGVLDYLEQTDKIQYIKEYVGCSVGSLVALLIVLGYSSTELKEIVKNYDFESLKKFKLSNLYKSYGLDNGEKISNFIKIFIKGRNLDPNITLLELYTKTSKNLVTVATNVTRKQTVFLHKENYPDMTVITSVRMSMCIPFVYSPIEYNGDLFVDGGLSCNLPSIYYNSDVKGILILHLKEVIEENKISTFTDYIYNILKIPILKITESCYDSFEVITINVKLSTTFNLKVSPEVRDSLYSSGYLAMKKFFSGGTVCLIDEKNA
jgi:patatin-like phospholipase